MITQKWERWSLGIVLAIAAILAALVSVGHVVAWTLVHSPPGTSPLAGVTNATISELLPFGGIVAYRVCRRSGRSVFFPVLLFLLGAGLSFNAQLAMASPGMSGAVASAAPMAAVMLITKAAVSLLAPHVDASESRPVSQANEAPVMAQKLAPDLEPAAATPALDPAVETPEATPQADVVSPKPTPLPDSRTPVRRRRDSLPPSLTTEGKVAAAVKKRGEAASLADLASEAGVSVSSVGRHLPGIRRSLASEKVENDSATPGYSGEPSRHETVVV